MVCAEPARAAQAAAPSSPQRLATCRSTQDTDINSRCAAVPNKPAPPRPRGCCGGPLLVVRHPTRPCQQGAISRSWISDKPDAAVLHKGVFFVSVKRRAQQQTPRRPVLSLCSSALLTLSISSRCASGGGAGILLGQYRLQAMRRRRQQTRGAARTMAARC